jgi:HK97 gp10 family phage protein
MPFSITVDISQATSLLSRVAQAASNDVPVKAFNAAAESLVSSATSTVPVITGNLRNSIRAGAATASGVEVTAEAEYAAFVELGTFKMSAEPYMKPGIPQAIQALVNTAVEALQSIT